MGGPSNPMGSHRESRRLGKRWSCLGSTVESDSRKADTFGQESENDFSPLKTRVVAGDLLLHDMMTECMPKSPKLYILLASSKLQICAQVVRVRLEQ